MDDYLRERQADVVKAEGLANAVLFALDEGSNEGENAAYASLQILIERLHSLNIALDSINHPEAAA